MKGHLIFSSICSVYKIGISEFDLSDDEQYVRNMPCYIKNKGAQKTPVNQGKELVFCRRPCYGHRQVTNRG